MNRETIYRLIARGELPAARHPHTACASIPGCGITGDHMSERAYRHAPRVLVVEDDTRLLFAIGEALTDAGYETATVADGHAATQKVHAFSPDVILLDLKMPFMGGDEFLSWLKQSGLKIPVVLSTNEDEVEASEVGAELKLSKPFTLEKLLEAVAAALNRSPASADGNH